ncbi:MAG: hypothetical protein AAFO94_10615 [Bacteroidota bacterium]
MKKSGILLAMLLLLISCTRENIKQILIEDDFRVYSDRFIEEAAKRGIDVDFKETGMVIQFGETPNLAAGVCYGMIEGQTSNHDILIDRGIWKQSSDGERERLIFHELGHCLLYRAHIPDTLASGEWKSIMRGVPPEGYGYRSTNYTGIRRQYYIDELFDRNIPEPEWARVKARYDDYSEAQKELLYETSNLNNFFRDPLLTSEDFEIELQFTYTDDFFFNYLGIVWGGSEDEAQSLILSGGNRLLIINRLSDYGVIRGFEFFQNINLNDTNTMTIRKVGDRNFYFFNEQYLYWSEVEPLRSNIARVALNQTFEPGVLSFKVMRLSE